MASAKLTTLAFYKWKIEHDDDLFSELVLPEEVNREVLINHILLESTPFECLYTDPDVYQFIIGVWSRANLEKWQKWVDAWEASSEFNPLENFDRAEHEVIQNSGTDENETTQTRNLAGSDNRTANLSNAETKNLTDLNTKDLTQLDTKNLTDLNTKDLTQLDTKNLEQLETRNLTQQDTRNLSDNETKNLSTERKVSAYDSSTYSPKELETNTGTDSITHTGTDTITNTGTVKTDNTGTDTVKTTGTDTVAHTGTDTVKTTGTDTTTQTGTDTVLTTGTDNHATTDTGTVKDEGSFTHGHKIERDARFHGNIGVTSMATLLSEWSDVVDKWDIYSVITHMFINEFCILVY